MEKFGLYVVHGQTSLLRCIDGVYTLIRSPYDMGATLPSEAWKILSTAKGYPCDQAWARTVSKESLPTTKVVASVLYGVPESVDVDTETRFERRR